VLYCLPLTDEIIATFRFCSTTPRAADRGPISAARGEKENRSESLARCAPTRFFLSVSAGDPAFDAERTRAELEALQPEAIHAFG
jgi:hypothetical protein